MNLTRRHALRSLGALGVAGPMSFTGAPALADTYPSQRITFVVPYPAGGNVDVTARIVGSRMQEILGQPIVIVNKGGAGGIIGGDFVKRANPDGYTLLVGSNGPLSLGPVFRKTSYDVKKDFTPIGLFSWTPDVIVVRDQFPVKSVAELVEYAKTKQVRAGTAGIETAPGIAMVQFNLNAGIKVLEVVYAGSAPFYPALMGGEIDVAFDQISTAMPMSQSGAVRILAITDSARSPLAPDLPTVAELGMTALVAGAFVGLVAPSGVPKPIIATLRDAYVKTMESPDIKERLEKIGSVVPATTQAALEEIIERDTTRARDVAARLNVKTER